MRELENAPAVVQLACEPYLRKTVTWSIALGTAVVAPALLSLNNHAAWATALTEETRAALIKSAEQGCFEGQSRQESNKSRKPEQLHALCHCVAEKMSYVITMEKASRPSASTAEEERVMRAVFDNCWQVNIK